MGVKDWVKKQKMKKLKGVEALDHGIVKGEGIPQLERWSQKSEVKYWGSMSEKRAYQFYMTLPNVKENPRLKSIAEFRKWNAKRKQILKNAEAEFRKKEGIRPDIQLSQAERNRLGEFKRQWINQINDNLGSRI